MKTLLTSTMLLLVFPQVTVHAGKAPCCPPQPACQPANSTVQCRTILPYHVALQRADVADQLEVLTAQQKSEIQLLKDQLLAVQQERDSFRKQAEQEKTLAIQARNEAQDALSKLQVALKQSQEAKAEAQKAKQLAENQRVKTQSELKNTTKKLDQTREALAKAEDALTSEQKKAATLQQARDVAVQHADELSLVITEMKARINQLEGEAPQKAPKPADPQPAKTEEPVKIKDDSESDNQDTTKK